ncbi:MAG: VOC family protein [Acidimicrobiia bacterium]|nr:VOC family protein [Acidimicrobiia bacterium]
MDEILGPDVPVGLNHAVLWVHDTAASALFYGEVLGLEVVAAQGEMRFLRSPSSGNDHDLGLFPTTEPPASGRRPGLYHLAWEVPTLAGLRAIRHRLERMGALVGASDHGATKSLYAHDPDGIEFEVMWEVPPQLLDDQVELTTEPLDLDGEIARYGADTPGGRAAR